MEKVIQEFKIVETDDGFRIEIKGDKEKIRDFVMGIDPRNWGGPWGWGRHHRHGGRRGPWVFAGKMRFGPPWMWWWCGGEEEEEKPSVKVKVEAEGEGGETV